MKKNEFSEVASNLLIMGSVSLAFAPFVLGDRLILSLDRGNFVFVQGSVFFKEGSSVTGAKIQLEQINADGSTKSIASSFSNSSGEFSFRRPPGNAKYRVTAKLKGISASKDVDIEEAAIYRVALTLDMSRNDR